MNDGPLVQLQEGNKVGDSNRKQSAVPSVRVQIRPTTPLPPLVPLDKNRVNTTSAEKRFEEQGPRPNAGAKSGFDKMWEGLKELWESIKKGPDF